MSRFFLLWLLLTTMLSMTRSFPVLVNQNSFISATSIAPRHQHSSLLRRFLSATADSSSSSSSSTTTTANIFKAAKPSQRHAQAELIQSLLYRIRQINNVPSGLKLVDFRLDGVVLGKVTPNIVKLLVNKTVSSGDSAADGGAVFQLVPTATSEASEQPQQQPIHNIDSSFLTLSPEVAGTTVESRTAAVQSVMQQLRDDGVIPHWRDEFYPMADGFYDTTLFLLERAAVPFLGGLEYGVHINGLVDVQNDQEGDDSNDSSPQKRKMMWMARRSPTKSKFPGMLDHIVAGGQPAGISVQDNAVKECLEEAGIPEDMARARLKPAGAVSYESYVEAQDIISRAVIFCYDLELPQDFVPTPVDGEVENFFLWSTEELFRSMAPDFHDPIKPNCYTVIIDYLVRAGYIDPDAPGYLDVVRELRSGHCK